MALATVMSVTTLAGLEGVFYHVVGTFDGARDRLYVNGHLQAAAQRLDAVDYGTRPMFLGSSGEKWEGRLAGTLGDVRLYGEALTPAEVSALFQANGAR